MKNESQIPRGYIPINAKLAASGSRFSFVLSLGELPLMMAAPVELQFNPIHVPARWTQIAKVWEIQNILNFLGSKNNNPLHLLPEIKRSFTSLNLKTRLKAICGAKIEEKTTNNFHLFPKRSDEKVSFEVTGEIPESAKKGDIVLVDITARYPESNNRVPRAVEFLEMIHIM